MQLGFALQQEQSQKLLMTTQMKQAIELLQCTGLELMPYLEQCAGENPCVELEFPEDLQAVWLHSGEPVRSGSTNVRTAPPLEQLIPCEPSLYDELSGQLGMMRMPDNVRRTALYIVGSLDENGFLTETDVDIATVLGVDLATVSEAVHYVQLCEPKGIGARNLQECLLLQLDGIPEAVRPLAEIIIRSHLDKVAVGKLGEIAKAEKQSVGTVQLAVDALKQLTPRPGAMYSLQNPAWVVPDVFVTRTVQGYVVKTNEGAEPKLTIPRRYQEWVKRAADPEVHMYLVKKLQSAYWLAKCLEQRRLTLQSVSEVIVEVQRGFFDHGEAYVKPLTLRQVADRVGVHESTVSRATRGKYMATPRGVYDMKFFFTAELSGASGTTSALAAKHAIRTLVESEDDGCPFSDEAIAQTLKQRGIQISRRTVAKYREELGIAPSWRRRRFVD